MPVLFFVLILDLDLYQPENNRPQLLIVLGADSDSDNVRLQLAQTDPRFLEHMKQELRLIRWTFKIKMVEEIDYDGSVTHTPSYRIGRGGALTAMPPNATCPCGCTIYFLNYLAADHQYSEATHLWQLKTGANFRFISWPNTYKNIPQKPDPFPWAAAQE